MLAEMLAQIAFRREQRDRILTRSDFLDVGQRR